MPEITRVADAPAGDRLPVTADPDDPFVAAMVRRMVGEQLTVPVTAFNSAL